MLSWNPRALPANALPTRRRQHLVGGTVRFAGGSWPRCTVARAERALHEPGSNQPTPDPSREGNRPISPAPLLGGAGGGFMVPMHSQMRKGTFHEPQGAAGILPAEGLKNNPDDETSAAPCWRHCPICFEFRVPALTGPDRPKAGLQTHGVRTERFAGVSRTWSLQPASPTRASQLSDQGSR